MLYEVITEKGIEKGKLEIALAMLSAGEEISKIEKFTGLLASQIEDLRSYNFV